jgi:hypothetical protein
MLQSTLQLTSPPSTPTSPTYHQSLQPYYISNTFSHLILLQPQPQIHTPGPTVLNCRALTADTMADLNDALSSDSSDSENIECYDYDATEIKYVMVDQKYVKHVWVWYPDSKKWWSMLFSDLDAERDKEGLKEAGV